MVGRCIWRGQLSFYSSSSPMANPYAAEAAASTTWSTSSIYLDRSFTHKYREIDAAILRDDLPYLLTHVLTKVPSPCPVNLSEDPLLSVLIAYGKTEMAIILTKEMLPESLEFPNYDGDTALHVAAAVGDVRAAEALVTAKPGMVAARNKKQEIPMHKAALYGEKKMFWKLVDKESDANARREDGSTALHCAVMGDAPKLALQISTQYPHQMFMRNSRAVTPLQLVVTIPQAFRSKLHLGPIESLIYKWIPLDEEEEEDDDFSFDGQEGDEEDLNGNELSYASSKNFGAADNYEDTCFINSLRTKFPPNYATFFHLLELISIPVNWIRVLAINILKQLSTKVQSLEQQKQHHRQVMKLITHLARDPEYWDFIDKGSTPEEGSNLPLRILDEDEHDMHQSDPTSETKKNRWDESPLTLGAKMGLHEFVKQILTVCPASAKYLDTEERNVLQVAIHHGNKKIVKIVESMVTGENPVLPSWLLSSIDKKTKNTILHFAAEQTVKEEAPPLQMQYELQWFEMVRMLVPKDLEHSRNENEKTAHELFSENHKEMVQSGKNQLMEMGKTCSGLVAAVVFASSFSIPGEKDSNNNPVFLHKIAFKVFSHAYVVGLSCAATALVLFLSLLSSSYQEPDFRRSLPTKYFFANVSFFLALMALLTAFSCNIYLNVYGGGKGATQDIVPLVCELTIFPAVCCCVLLYRGSTFGLDFVRNVWR